MFFFVQITKQTITISWAEPLHNGGSPITSYLVEISTNEALDFVSLQPIGSDVRSFVITELTDDTVYNVRVRAVNQVGEGEPSDVVYSIKTGDYTGKKMSSTTFYYLLSEYVM